MGGCGQAHDIMEAWGKRAVSSFLPRLFHSRKAEGAGKGEQPHKWLMPGALPGFPEGEETGSTCSTSQTPKDSRRPWEVAVPG